MPSEEDSFVGVSDSDEDDDEVFENANRRAKQSRGKRSEVDSNSDSGNDDPKQQKITFFKFKQANDPFEDDLVKTEAQNAKSHKNTKPSTRASARSNQLGTAVEEGQCITVAHKLTQQFLSYLAVSVNPRQPRSSARISSKPKPNYVLVCLME